MFNFYSVAQYDLEEAKAHPPWNPRVFDWMEKEYGKEARGRLEAFYDIAVKYEHVSDEKKLEVVNNYFNDLPYIPDSRHWHKKDYWALPFETLGTYGGDCEDLAIAKYVALTIMGLDYKKLHLLYVLYLPTQQAHMVLAYHKHKKDDSLILDSIDRLIVKASLRDDLGPVYALNDVELLFYKDKREIRKGGPGKVSVWKKLVEREHHQDEEIEKFIHGSIHQAHKMITN